MLNVIFFSNFGKNKNEMNPDKKVFITEEESKEIAMNRTYTERFRMLMKLIRIDRMLRNAKIVEAKDR